MEPYPFELTSGGKFNDEAKFICRKDPTHVVEQIFLKEAPGNSGHTIHLNCAKCDPLGAYHVLRFQFHYGRKLF